MAEFEQYPEEIEEDFPRAKAEGYEIKSEQDLRYNCLAFAVGDLNHWWDIDQNCGMYWPPGIPRDVGVPVIERILKLHGFTVPVEEHDLGAAIEAAAIFGGSDGPYTHVAKWSGGKWTSKLGRGHDIEHTTLRALESDLYGTKIMILARQSRGSAA